MRWRWLSVIQIATTTNLCIPLHPSTSPSLMILISGGLSTMPIHLYIHLCVSITLSHPQKHTYILSLKHIYTHFATQAHIHTHTSPWSVSIISLSVSRSLALGFCVALMLGWARRDCGSVMRKLHKMDPDALTSKNKFGMTPIEAAIDFKLVPLSYLHTCTLSHTFLLTYMMASTSNCCYYQIVFSI